MVLPKVLKEEVLCETSQPVEMERALVPILTDEPTISSFIFFSHSSCCFNSSLLTSYTLRNLNSQETISKKGLADEPIPLNPSSTQQQTPTPLSPSRTSE